MLDFTSCTECGRCQSQCPAWNTEKPLSPKLLVMGLRDHAYAKAPYLLAEEPSATSLPDGVKAEAERELVGATEGDAWSADGGAVIDPDVLWSCTSCGACVQQCPVDIEHVDHIMDMRRYQVLVESNFPAELNQLFKGLENKGNPWNMAPNARMDWAKDLPFEVKQVGADVEDLTEVEWLFWVGCAGAYEDRAKKTTRAVAELLHTGRRRLRRARRRRDLHRRPGAAVGQRVRLPAARDAERRGAQGDQGEEGRRHLRALLQHPEERVRRSSASSSRSCTTPSCSTGWSARAGSCRSPPTDGSRRRHARSPTTTRASSAGTTRSTSRRASCSTSSRARRSRRCRATPSGRSAAAPAVPGCGWRRRSASGSTSTAPPRPSRTGADQIAVGCPFCRVMLSDGLTSLQADGKAREEVEVLDVAQLLLAVGAARRARPTTRPQAERAL